MVNLPMIGGIALDNIEKGLNKKNQDILAIFPTDTIISYLLTAAPASILGVMLFFSSSSFGESSLVCAPPKNVFPKDTGMSIKKYFILV